MENRATCPKADEAGVREHRGLRVRATVRVARILTTFTVLASVFVIGCGGNGLPMVAVSGRVTFNGGECPAPGTVEFIPIEATEGLPSRPAVGAFGTDGRFEVTSFDPGDGLLPGKYKVSVTCQTGVPDINSKDPWGDITHIDPSYEPEELIVERGSSALTLELDVPRKK